MKKLLFGRKSQWVNSSLVAMSQGLSGLLGLTTQVVATRSVGIGNVTDGFFVVYVVADAVAGVFFSLTLLVLVPRILQGDRLSTEGRALCWMFGSLTSGLLAVLAAATWALAPQLAPIFGPNLASGGLDTAVTTLKIVAPLLVINGVAAIAAATLQAVHQFLVASLGKILFALGPFIASLLLLERFGLQALAWAAVISGMIYAIYLWLILAQVNGVPKVSELFAARSAAFESAAGLMPVSIARTSTELWWFVVRALATGIPGGATILVIAQRFSSVLHLIGNSIASVAYPDIVRELSAGKEAIIKMTRVRCDQCLTCMSIVAWPMAGIAGDLVWLVRHRESSLDSSGIDASVLCVGVFLLTVPWATVNGMLGNTTWALRYVWSRLSLQLGVMIAFVPLLWMGIAAFGIVAVPCILLLESLTLLAGGELLLRRLVKYPVIDHRILRRWFCLSLVGVLTMAISWGVSLAGSLLVGEQLSLRLITMGFAFAAGSISATLLFLARRRTEAHVWTEAKPTSVAHAESASGEEPWTL